MICRGEKRIFYYFYNAGIIKRLSIPDNGATRIPEALRLVSNLQMANKLLVRIDGRFVYNPLYGGVYWDVQNVMMSILDRIEVVSGPEGTLWGANTVNGVINSIRKTAKGTQGVYISGAGGFFLQDHFEVQYGFCLDSNIFCRVYGQRFDQKNTTLVVNGANAKDAWNIIQGGFRVDYDPSQKNTWTLMGDFYGGAENSLTTTRTETGFVNIPGSFYGKIICRF